ncbi:hypothetical protein [Leuconostoc carnosum]
MAEEAVPMVLVSLALQMIALIASIVLDNKVKLEVKDMSFEQDIKNCV